MGIKWLFYDEGKGLSVPEFSEHNGQSAKRRATETKRKRKERADSPDPVRKVSAQHADKKRSREDKREEKNTPVAPKGAAVRFEEFWLAWPKSERKQDKAKCLVLWTAGKFDVLADTILADVKAKRGARKWQEEGGKYIEAPERYLRNKRWEDGSAEGAEAMQETFV